MRRSLLVLLPLFLLACAKGAPGSSSRRIAVIPKGTTHVFWKAVEAGARKGASESGLEITWKGPLVENDRAQQIQLVQQFLGEDVAGWPWRRSTTRRWRRPSRARSSAVSRW
jgi:ribose transport system substrate-binding protein